MAQTADLVTVLHDIDTLRGKVCRTCKHWSTARNWLRRNPHGCCAKGYNPDGPDDGCDDWSARGNQWQTKPVDYRKDFK